MNGVSKKKEKLLFACTECGYQQIKWLGRCPECGAWGSLEERREKSSKDSHLGQYLSSEDIETSVPVPLLQAPDGDEERLVSGIAELDRALGGGVVTGSVTLIGGEPGIGKSTLLLQLLGALAKNSREVLYVSGEESARQVKMRANRLGVVQDGQYLAVETGVERIIEMAAKMKPALLAVDSVQTLACGDIASSPGSVTQIRESAYRLIDCAKLLNIPVILIGHVTKDGSIAGPKVLEHMVDTVLYFEGDRSHAFRILRTIKNRFGSTNEIGVFEMKEGGLVEVSNPSEIFLAERPLNEPGSVVLPSVEGTRPILVEVQALVSPTNLGTARRTAIGADHQRLSLLCAILEKKAGIDMYGNDVFLNIAGGIRIEETALDLGVVCALSSSLLNKSVSPTTAVCGEIGLAGEVRAVGHIDIRVKEAERLGFSRLIVPLGNRDRLGWQPQIELVGISNISDVMDIVFT